MTDASNITLSTDQIASLTVANVSASIVSCVSSCFVILLFLYFKNERRFSFKLVVMLSISDIGNDIGNFLGDPNVGPVCVAQSVITSFFELAAVLWTFIMALTYFLIVVRRIPSATLEKHEVWYHVGCWGLSALMAGLPFTTNSYGDAGAWCWIRPEGAGVYWRFFQFYFFLWLVFVLNNVLYIITIVQVHNQVKQLGGVSPTNDVKRMAVYPLLLLVGYSWATVNRIQNWAAPDSPQYWLYLLHVIFSSLIGLFNVIVYATSPSLRAAMKSEYERLRMCGFLRRGKTDTAPLTALDDDAISATMKEIENTTIAMQARKSVQLSALSSPPPPAEPESVVTVVSEQIPPTTTVDQV